MGFFGRLAQKVLELAGALTDAARAAAGLLPPTDEELTSLEQRVAELESKVEPWRIEMTTLADRAEDLFDRAKARANRASALESARRNKDESNGEAKLSAEELEDLQRLEIMRRSPLGG